ncbi:hypothetical protein M0805_002724 [Coniferiporia weirii]|nr:hypothetical protein M0805_002724 [Coniferiporia weirii]
MLGSIKGIISSTSSKIALFYTKGITDASTSSETTREDASGRQSPYPYLIRDTSLLDLQKPEDIKDSLLLLHPDLLDELEFWFEGLRPLDEEDINYKDGHENKPPPPTLSRTQKHLTSVVSKNFTHKIVNEGLGKALGLDILYSGVPDPEVRDGKAEGGYAFIHAVKLREPRMFSVEVYEDDGSLTNVEWEISKVAVKHEKIYDPEEEHKFCTRMVREARIWCRMRHRNIAPLLGLWSGFDPEKPLHSFVFPWFEEGSLASYILTHRTPVLQKLSFLRDIAPALNYMHNHDFKAVHGDLRANNVLVKDKRAYLTDFGLSRLFDAVVGFTRTVNSEAGNIRYIAPERFMAETEKGTVYSDIYEFASVFLEVWTENVPWAELGDNATHIIVSNVAFRGERPARPEGIRDEYWNLLHWCWAKNPEARPTAKQVLYTLNSFIAQENAV